VLGGQPEPALVPRQYSTISKERNSGMESSTDAFETADDFQASDNSSEASYLTRPNRFVGPNSTWREFTEEDRLVHNSMTKLRDQDLSVHLYNAHAMKRRNYDEKIHAKLKPWASKVSLLF
jgi:hypothetical protein